MSPVLMDYVAFLRDQCIYCKKKYIYVYSIVGSLIIMGTKKKGIFREKKNIFTSTKNNVTYKRLLGNRFVLMNNRKVPLYKIPQSVQKALRKRNSVTVPIKSTQTLKRSSSSGNNTQRQQYKTTHGFFPPNTRAFTKPNATNKVSTIVQQNNPQIKINASLVAHNDLGHFTLAVQYFELLMKNYNYILSELFEPLYETKMK